jgi:hypothetical protein
MDPDYYSLALAVAIIRYEPYATRQCRTEGDIVVVRFLIAVAVGVVLALGASFITGEVLTGVANGSRPANEQLYNYGTR